MWKKSIFFSLTLHKIPILRNVFYYVYFFNLLIKINFFFADEVENYKLQKLQDFELKKIITKKYFKTNNKKAESFETAFSSYNPICIFLQKSL